MEAQWNEIPFPLIIGWIQNNFSLNRLKVELIVITFQIRWL